MNFYVDMTDDKRTYDDYPEIGAPLVMSHGSTTNLTKCKVAVPFSDDDLHITIPTNQFYKDVVRYHTLHYILHTHPSYSKSIYSFNFID